MSAQSKKENSKQVTDQLIDLKERAGLNNKTIAQLLSVRPEWITRIKQGAKVSGALAASIDRLHKEHFSKAKGSGIHLGDETPDYSGPLEKILGPAGARMALELANDLEFESVGEYLRYLMRAEHAARFGDGRKGPGPEPSGEADGPTKSQDGVL